ncbi:uncharacterized protein LOC142817258 [Rhipicephalus microplus]|uniref:uncharacterized protein LOC142817258 n=1 Tax=Rhipicephalus microplus TaxID=6941 RepID=UPI003F6D617C
MAALREHCYRQSFVDKGTDWSPSTSTEGVPWPTKHQAPEPLLTVGAFQLLFFCSRSFFESTCVMQPEGRIILLLQTVALCGASSRNTIREHQCMQNHRGNLIRGP